MTVVMGSYQPQGLAQQAFGAAVLLLLAAAAINWAVGLLSAVWVGLVLLGSVLIASGVAIRWWRGQRGGW